MCSQGQSALHLARRKRHTGCIDALEHAGAMLTLLEAAEAGDAAMIEALGASGCDMSIIAAARDRSALHVAAQYGHTACIQALLQHKADVNMLDQDGHSALFTASMHHNHHCAAALAAAGGMLSVVESVEEGDIATVEALGCAGANLSILDRDGRAALHRAVIKDDAACITALAAARADLNVLDVQGHTALFMARRFRSQDCVDALEACGARLHITEAAEVGDVPTIEALALANADLNLVNVRGVAAVHIACEQSSPSCIEALVRGKANIDKRDSAGWACVHKAACSGSALCIAALARGGSNLDVVSPDGGAAIHHAAAACDANCIRALIEGRCVVGLHTCTLHCPFAHALRTGQTRTPATARPASTPRFILPPSTAAWSVLYSCCRGGGQTSVR
jgi:serine/threonine-protein phosphatase 6 regulatory ankyrin repeat subunit A